MQCWSRDPPWSWRERTHGQFWVKATKPWSKNQIWLLDPMNQAVFWFFPSLSMFGWSFWIHIPPTSTNKKRSLQIINRHKVKGIVGRSRFQGGLDCFGDSNWMEESEGWKTVISNHFYHSPDLALEVLLLVVKNCDLLHYHLLSFRIMQTYGFGKPINSATHLSNISKAQNERMFFKVCQCGVFQCFWDFCKPQGRPKALKTSVCKGHQPYFRPQPGPAQVWKAARSICKYKEIRTSHSKSTYEAGSYYVPIIA